MAAIGNSLMKSHSSQTFVMHTTKHYTMTVILMGNFFIWFE